MNNLSGGAQKREYIFAALVLLLLHVIFLKDVLCLLPLNNFDELMYLGLSAVPRFPMVDWGPIYVCWYRVLRFFFQNSVAVFYCNAAIVTTGLSFSTFILLARLKTTAIFSLLGGAWVLFSLTNLPLLPKINHYNTIAIIALMIFIMGLSWNRAEKCLFAAVALLGLCYLRQDNLIPAGEFFIMGIYFFRKEKIENSRKFLFSILFSQIIFLFLFYSPFGDRAWNAFTDHFLWEEQKNRPSLTREYVRSVLFADSNNIFSAAMSKPAQILLYGLKNLSDFFCAKFVYALTSHFSIFSFFKKSRNFSYSILELLVPANLIFFWGVYKFRCWKNFPPMELVRRIKASPLFLIWLIFAIKTLIIVFFMTPSERYFLDFIILTIVLVLTICARIVPRMPGFLLLGFSVFLIAQCPGLSDESIKNYFSDGKQAEFKKTLFFLQKNISSADVVWGGVEYTGYTKLKNSYWVLSYPEHLREQFSLKEFLHDLFLKRVNLIIVGKGDLEILADNLSSASFEIMKSCLLHLENTGCIIRQEAPASIQFYKVDRACAERAGW